MKQELTRKELVYKIEKIISEKNGNLSVEETAMITGDSIHGIQEAFSRLIELYQCDYKIDMETGKIEFKFQLPLQPKKDKTFKEKITSFAVKTYDIFKKSYMKIFGSVIFIYCTTFFILFGIRFFLDILIDRSGWQIVRNYFKFAKAIFNPKKLTEKDKKEAHEFISGFSFKKKKANKEKYNFEIIENFLPSFHDFVFGTQIKTYSEENNAKEAIAFIRKNNGYINTSNIVELTGCSLETAEKNLIQFSLKFKGDIEISDSGYPTAYFFTIANSNITENYDGNIILYKDEKIPDIKLIGTNKKLNTIDVIFNLINMTGATYVYYQIQGFEKTGLFSLIFCAIPMILSLLFFVIPLLRLPNYFSKKNKNNIEKFKKKLLLKILDSPLNPHFEKKDINDKNFKKLIKELLKEYSGEVEIDLEGKPVYKFERLAYELVKQYILNEKQTQVIP